MSDLSASQPSVMHILHGEQECQKSSPLFPLYLTSNPLHYFRLPSIPQLGSSDELLERAIERRAKGLDVLVKVDGRNSTLGDAFGRELEFLRAPSQPSTRVALPNISRTKELTL